MVCCCGLCAPQPKIVTWGIGIKYFSLILQKSYWKLDQELHCLVCKLDVKQFKYSIQKDKKPHPFTTEQDIQVKIIYDSNYGINQLVSS